MFFHFRDRYPQLNVFWEKYQPFLRRMELPAKKVLLEEGKRSQQYIMIEEGCVRAFFNSNGEEKTVQFFFEKQGLSSIDSFLNNVPSPFAIETIEPSVVSLLHKKYVIQLMDEMGQDPQSMKLLLQMAARRQQHYINELMSFVRDTPEQRYSNLLKDRPHIIQRVPQHYIASYLGVSAVHLSRIKAKLAKGNPHF